MKQTAHAFRQLKSHLDKVSNTKFVKVQDAALKIILQRTVEFGSIKKKTSQNIFKNQIVSAYYVHLFKLLNLT